MIEAMRNALGILHLALGVGPVGPSAGSGHAPEDWLIQCSDAKALARFSADICQIDMSAQLEGQMPIISLANMTADLAEKALLASRMILRIVGVCDSFALSVEDYLEGELEYEAEAAVAHLGLATALTFNYCPDAEKDALGLYTGTYDLESHFWDAVGVRRIHSSAVYAGQQASIERRRPPLDRVDAYEPSLDPILDALIAVQWNEFGWAEHFIGRLEEALTPSWGTMAKQTDLGGHTPDRAMLASGLLTFVSRSILLWVALMRILRGSIPRTFGGLAAGAADALTHTDKLDAFGLLIVAVRSLVTLGLKRSESGVSLRELVDEFL